MWFYQRNLPPIEIDEFAAGVTLEAIEWHIGHLADRMRETRDVVDREGWATARVQRFSLEGVRRLIYGHLRDMGPPPYDVASEVRSRISGYSFGLPQSAANAELLKAERDVKASAGAERKSARARDREASRRMAGGKWARPRITFSGADLEPLDGDEL